LTGAIGLLYPSGPSERPDMGRFDRRNSMKMRRRKSQEHLAQREERRVAAVKAERHGAEKPEKKPRS